MKLLPADPWRRKATLVAILALAGAYSAHAYLYAPALRESEARRLRLSDLEERNERAAAAAQGGEARLEDRVVRYESYVTRLESLLPAGHEVPALLEAVSAEERRAGVEVTMMRPEPPEPGEFYDRRSYEMQVEGSYHAVGRFLTAVASLERIIAPADLSIAPAVPAEADRGGEGRVIAHFWIRTYVVSSTG